MIQFCIPQGRPETSNVRNSQRYCPSPQHCFAINNGSTSLDSSRKIQTHPSLCYKSRNKTINKKSQMYPNIVTPTVLRSLSQMTRDSKFSRQYLCFQQQKKDKKINLNCTDQVTYLTFYVLSIGNVLEGR